MIEIVYEDRAIIVVVKPPGMPSQKDPTGDEDVFTAVKSMIEARGERVALGLVQRLDRPVGGLMVMSKHQEASRRLTAQVTNREIHKYYLALVDGESKRSEHLEHWLQKVRGNRSVISGNKTAAGKLAILDYKCLKTYEFKGEKRSLLEIQLHTGRHHQIRAQMAHVKLPLVGDTKYNPNYQQLKGWHKIGLYAYKLELEHPINGESLSFERWPDKFGE